MAEWKHGLFGCFDNCTLCIVTFLIPCYTFGKTAEAVGEGCCLCAVAWLFTGCIAGGVIRGKIRDQKGIHGSAFSDFLVHMCCPLCAIIQDSQEVVIHASDGQSISRE